MMMNDKLCYIIPVNLNDTVRCCSDKKQSYQDECFSLGHIH